MMTDGHKLGSLPIATGFFLARDRELFEAIPTERTLIHTTSSTKPGARRRPRGRCSGASAADGYRQGRRAGDADDGRAGRDGIAAVPGLRLVMPPAIAVLCFTSDCGRCRRRSTRG